MKNTKISCQLTSKFSYDDEKVRRLSILTRNQTMYFLKNFKHHLICLFSKDLTLGKFSIRILRFVFLELTYMCHKNKTSSLILSSNFEREIYNNFKNCLQRDRTQKNLLSTPEV